MSDALRLPLPPSANRLWRVMRGRPVKSEAYRAWRQDAAEGIAHQRAFQPPLRWFSVAIALPETARDPDNAIKPILDALQEGGAIVDDKHLRGLTLDVLDDAEPETVILRLFDAPPPATVAAREELQRRAWEAAHALFHDFRERLTPAPYARVYRMTVTAPEDIRPEQAAAMLRLYGKLVEARR